MTGIDYSRVTFAIRLIPEESRPKNSSLRYHIVALYDGELISRKDGRPYVVAGSLRSHSYQCEDMADMLNDCATCKRQALGAAGPEHKGSPNCHCGSIASGGKTAHCSCGTCF